MDVESMKKQIDSMTYEQLLRKWRFEPVGSPWFYGEVGDYYRARMDKLRSEDPAEAVRASKSLGWG